MDYFPILQCKLLDLGRLTHLSIILDLVFSLWSHFLLFMLAASCRVNFSYFVDFVGCPCMISNHDFISGNSNQSTLHLRALIHSNVNSYWSKYMQKTDDVENSPFNLKKCTHFRLDCSL